MVISQREEAIRLSEIIIQITISYCGLFTKMSFVLIYIARFVFEILNENICKIFSNFETVEDKKETKKILLNLSKTFHYIVNFFTLFPTKLHLVTLLNFLWIVELIFNIFTYKYIFQSSLVDKKKQNFSYRKIRLYFRISVTFVLFLRTGIKIIFNKRPAKFDQSAPRNAFKCNRNISFLHKFVRFTLKLFDCREFFLLKF